jgi:hypothetical protein
MVDLVDARGTVGCDARLVGDCRRRTSPMRVRLRYESRRSRLTTQSHGVSSSWMRVALAGWGRELRSLRKKLRSRTADAVRHQRQEDGRGVRQ